MVETGIKTKNLALCDYSLLCVTHFVKAVHPEFYTTENGLSLGCALANIIEAKKTRFTKVVKPILKEIEKKGVDLNVFLTAALMTEFKAAGEAEDAEMQEKGGSPAEICQRRSGVIVAELAPAKKVDKSSTFRSFMRTQKQELGGSSLISEPTEKNSMTLGPKDTLDCTLVVKEELLAQVHEPEVKKEE